MDKNLSAISYISHSKIAQLLRCNINPKMACNTPTSEETNVKESYLTNEETTPGMFYIYPYSVESFVRGNLVISLFYSLNTGTCRSTIFLVNPNLDTKLLRLVN